MEPVVMNQLMDKVIEIFAAIFIGIILLGIVLNTLDTILDIDSRETLKRIWNAFLKKISGDGYRKSDNG